MGVPTASERPVRVNSNSVDFIAVDVPEVGDLCTNVSEIGFRVSEVNHDGTQVRLAIGTHGRTGWMKTTNYTFKRMVSHV